MLHPWSFQPNRTLERMLILQRRMTDDISGPDPVAPSKWRLGRHVARGLSLSRLQSIVAILAGIGSVSGAVFSVAHVAARPGSGELVTVIQAAGSRRAVPDATVEILNSQEALVATLTPDAAGRAHQQLPEGLYLVKVSHVRFAAETRRVQVLPEQTTEVRTSLRAGSSTASGRPPNRNVSFVRKIFRF